MRLIGCCVVAGVVGAAGAQPDYDFTWKTIGSPGNRPANETEAPRWYQPHNVPPPSKGQVDYRYRLSQTEVTVTQWFEFVNAYAPHWDGHPGDPQFTSDWIFPNGDGGFVIEQGAEYFPSDSSWRVAARYCNWLHNGKASEAWAFESGVYDTSTFGENPDGTFTDQRDPSPGSKYWIPTLDEWIKGMYYDPDRYGDGVEGYWKFPTSSDEEPITGPPGQGQTSAGNPDDPIYVPVGSYPDVMSPWGLLDGSGGQTEWTTTVVPQGSRRYHKGTDVLTDPRRDELDRNSSSSAPQFPFTGLRLASVIPTPSTFLAGGVLSITLTRRMRR